MKVKIKKLYKEAVIPQYAHDGDAGMDLVAISKNIDIDGNVVFGTGLAFEIPKGYVGLLFPRSSNSKKHLILSNSVGVLDSGYRGELFFKFKPSAYLNNEKQEVGNKEEQYDRKKLEYNIGDKIGQIIIMSYPIIELEEVDELSPSERGNEGFGSTGN